MKINPIPPFLWPESRIFAEIANYETPVPIEQHLRKAKVVLGVVTDVTGEGVEWLETVLLRPASYSVCKLIVAVYGACRTTSADLQLLLDLQTREQGRVEFHLLLAGSIDAAPTNILYIEDDAGQALMSIGSTPNFGLAEKNPGQLNFVFHPEAVLLNEWRKWFDWVWLVEATPLNNATVTIPQLVPARGTDEAEILWEEYEAKCRVTRKAEASAKAINVSVDAQTGEVIAETPTGEPIPSPTAETNIPKFNLIAERTVRLFTKGMMVTIDKGSRIRPLDAPMKPEWFGIDSFRQIGAVSRAIRYRISLIDEKTLREIENRRKATRDLLTHFSFPLAEGVRWMPHDARDYFEQEISRVNTDALALLQRIVHGDADKFIKTQCARIRKDADDMYQEFRPGEKLPDEVIEDIMADLTSRLHEALNGKVLPKVTYTEVKFSPTTKTEWSDAWAHAVMLLAGIAEFPRKVICDPFFLRGVRIDRRDILRVMNVCDDALLRAQTPSWLSTNTEEELSWIAEITSSKADTSRICEGLYCIIDGSYLRCPGCSITSLLARKDEL